MDRFIKYFYVFITALFTLFTAYEMYVYLSMDSNYFGIVYLFLNFFVMFLLFTITYNYSSQNKGIRISKNILVIVIGIFSSFILTYVLPYILSYSDNSYLFEEKVFVTSKILKPVIYAFVVIVSIIEVKLFNKKK